MAQYTLTGEEKEIAVIGIYASIKNNSDNVMYASASAQIDISSESVTPIQAGESTVIASNNEKKVYVIGTGDIAILSGNEKFNFFKPAPKGGSGGGGEGITEQQLNDALKPYATTVSVNNKLEAYATSESVTEGLSGKVDIIEGMGLSENSFSDDEKTKLASLSNYDDTEIETQLQALNNKKADKTDIPTSLPADGGHADTASELTVYRAHRTTASNGKPYWVKFAESKFTRSSLTASLKCECCDSHRHKGNYPNQSDEFYGCYDILFRKTGERLERAEVQWEYLSGAVNPSDIVMAYYIDSSNIYHVACFANLSVSYVGICSVILTKRADSGQDIVLLNNDVGTEEIPSEYTTIVPSTVMPLRGVSDEIANLKAYIGYTDSDIYGLEADFENNKFTRLAGAVGKTAGADFDSVNAFGGRRRCNLSDNGEVLAYYGESGYVENGTNGQVMVEQPRFYYKIVPLKTEKIDGAEGYHLRKARYYISDTPKAGFKVHPAFVQNGVEIDKIYLSAYEGCIYDLSTSAYLLADEQIADFNNDLLSSVANAKPASGVSQSLNIANSRKLAQNRGDGWSITSIQTLSVTQLLFPIEYATFNSQEAIGMGISTKPTGTDNSSENTGLTAALGNASGQVSSGAISYRGEENIWGNIMSVVDGCTIVYDNSDFISINVGEQTNIRIKAQAGYISAFYYDPITDWAFLPSETSGTSAVPVGDQLYTTTNRNIHSDFYAGGDWYHGYATGLYMSYFIWITGQHHKQAGTRLIYIPQKPKT